MEIRLEKYNAKYFMVVKYFHPVFDNQQSQICEKYVIIWQVIYKFKLEKTKTIKSSTHHLICFFFFFFQIIIKNYVISNEKIKPAQLISAQIMQDETIPILSNYELKQNTKEVWYSHSFQYLFLAKKQTLHCALCLQSKASIQSHWLV